MQLQVSIVSWGSACVTREVSLMVMQPSYGSVLVQAFLTSLKEPLHRYVNQTGGGIKIGGITKMLEDKTKPLNVLSRLKQ